MKRRTSATRKSSSPRTTIRLQSGGDAQKLLVRTHDVAWSVRESNCVKSNNSKKRNSKVEIVHAPKIARIAPKIFNNKWLLHSGADTHICVSRRVFEVLRSTEVAQIYPYGGGAAIKVEGKGDTVKGIDGKVGKLRLNNVLYVPTGTENVISTAALADAGFVFRQTSVEIVVYRKGQHQAFCKAKREGMGYYIESSETLLRNITTQRTHPIEKLIHERLGHPGQNAMRLVYAAYGDQVSKPLSTITCRECIEQRGVASSHPSKQKPTEVLERLEADLWYATMESYDGYLYALTLQLSL